MHFDSPKIQSLASKKVYKYRIRYQCVLIPLNLIVFVHLYVFKRKFASLLPKQEEEVLYSVHCLNWEI